MTPLGGDPETVRREVARRVSIGAALRIKFLQKPEAYGNHESEYEAWDSYNNRLLRRLFPDEDDIYREYRGSTRTVDSRWPSDKLTMTLVEDSLDKKVAALKSIRTQVELFPPPSTGINSADASIEPSPSKRVFIVHGRDLGSAESVARLISRLEFEPVILHEAHDRGRTVLEKFEDEGRDACFAIVIFSPDDEGRLRDSGGPSDKTESRARQNVLLEFGFFVGRRGRDRVVALVPDVSIALPSDIHGLIYKEMDSGGGWKIELAKEMRAAGLPIDLNKL